MLLESERPALTITAPPRPPGRDDPEALFKEARQHRRQRRLRLAAITTVLVLMGVGAYSAFSSGITRSPPAATGQQRPDVTAANPTVVLLVDVSGSMRATDIKPGRLDAAIAAMQTFLRQLPQRSRVGLVAFSDLAAVDVTPTLDRETVLTALSQLSPEAGTNLGAGLATAVKLTVNSFKQQGVRLQPGHYLPAAIVLASDGAQNRGTLSPLHAAERARAAGIRVDGIALGTATGSVNSGYGNYAESIPVPSDPQSVRMIARVTGGQAFTATNANHLNTIYRQLGSSINH